MKKSVFDLTYKEGKQIDKAMRKTSHYKQYACGCLAILFIFCFVVGFVYGYVSANDSIDSNTLEIFKGIIITIGLGFSSIILVLFTFKRFDLVKKYYEEKVEK